MLDYRADLGAVWPAAERVDEVSTLTLNGEPVAFEPRDMLAEELAEFGAACAARRSWRRAPPRGSRRCA